MSTAAPWSGTEPAIGDIAAARPAAWLRLHLTYLWRHKRVLKLARPTLFTELVQHRKLHDRSPLLPILADKLLVKKYVADRLGPQWIIPTLWHGAYLPTVPSWPLPFVVKSRHGCKQRAFVRTGKEDWGYIRRQAVRWTRQTYGIWLDEWLYRHVEKGLLVEPFVGSDGILPIDYKFYVFDGRVAFIQVHLHRETRHRWIIFDRAWRRVSAPSPDADPIRPHMLDTMIDAAETLGHGFDFVRTDFYEVNAKPLFGEMTFYPGSGLDPFQPVSLDATMGALWLCARSGGLRLSPSDNELPCHYNEIIRF